MFQIDIFHLENLPQDVKEFRNKVFQNMIDNIRKLAYKSITLEDMKSFGGEIKDLNNKFIENGLPNFADLSLSEPQLACGLIESEMKKYSEGTIFIL